MTGDAAGGTLSPAGKLVWCCSNAAKRRHGPAGSAFTRKGTPLCFALQRDFRTQIANIRHANSRNRMCRGWNLTEASDFISSNELCSTPDASYLNALARSSNAGGLRFSVMTGVFETRRNRALPGSSSQLRRPRLTTGLHLIDWSGPMLARPRRPLPAACDLARTIKESYRRIPGGAKVFGHAVRRPDRPLFYYYGQYHRFMNWSEVRHGFGSDPTACCNRHGVRLPSRAMFLSESSIRR